MGKCMLKRRVGHCVLQEWACTSFDRKIFTDIANLKVSVWFCFFVGIPRRNGAISYGSDMTFDVDMAFITKSEARTHMKAKKR